MRIHLTPVLLIGATLFLLSGRGFAASEMDALEELRNCARTEDSAARVACYEELGKRVLGEESIKTAEVAVVESVSSQPEPQRLPDDLGIANKEDKNAAEDESYRGHVRSCGQLSDDRWYFVFDNEQLWKQSSAGRYRFSECDFDVTITKDFFGYKMKIDGGKTLRVKRER
jgi:hypothetical protein